MADDVRKQRYDMATIPHDVYSRDPSLILGSIKQLVEARGQIGDLVIIQTPPGTGSETSRHIARALEDRDDIPGLPGGP